MAQRINVGQPLQPKIVRPTAPTVDTYVQPRRDTNVEQIATALSQLVPSLSRFSGILGEQKGAQDRLEGQHKADRMRDAGKKITEEVRSGKRKPYESQWFRVGYYETAGRNSGAKYVDEFVVALGKSDAKDSVELSDFDDFERKFRSDWLSQNLGGDSDAFLMNAFGSTADGQIASLRNSFAHQAGARMVKQNTENFHAEIFGQVESFARTGEPLAEQAAKLRLAQERQFATGGMDYEQINRQTASAITAVAIRMKDVEVLDLLDHIPTSLDSKGRLGGTSYGAEFRQNAESAIARAINDDTQRAAVIEKREREQSIKTISGGMMDALAKDPGLDIAPYLKEVRKVDPSYAPTLISMRDVIAGGVMADDPELVRELTIGIHTSEPGAAGYTTQRNLDRAFGAKRLTYQTYRTLSADLNTRDENGGSGKFLRHPVLTDIAAEAYRVFASEYREDTPAVRHLAQQAADEAQSDMLSWLLKNPNATPKDLLEAQSEIRNRVVLRRSGIQETLIDEGVLTPFKIPPARFYLADPALGGQFTRELEQIKTGGRNAFSLIFITTLRRNGIDPADLAEVEKFLKEQSKWDVSPSSKP